MRRTWRWFSKPFQGVPRIYFDPKTTFQVPQKTTKKHPSINRAQSANSGQIEIAEQGTHMDWSWNSQTIFCSSDTTIVYSGRFIRARATPQDQNPDKTVCKVVVENRLFSSVWHLLSRNYERSSSQKYSTELRFDQNPPSVNKVTLESQKTSPKIEIWPPQHRANLGQYSPTKNLI